jgi:hypothetical protein
MHSSSLQAVLQNAIIIALQALPAQAGNKKI